LDEMICGCVDTEDGQPRVLYNKVCVRGGGEDGCYKERLDSDRIQKEISTIWASSPDVFILQWLPMPHGSSPPLVEEEPADMEAEIEGKEKKNLLPLLHKPMIPRGYPQRRCSSRRDSCQSRSRTMESRGSFAFAFY
jgi:hypothetical protein